MDNGNINSCARQSAFLAQTEQESAEYNLMVEQSNACENNPAYPVNFPSPSPTVADIPSKMIFIEDIDKTVKAKLMNL
jgi:hypothetical protein